MAALVATLIATSAFAQGAKSSMDHGDQHGTGPMAGYMAAMDTMMETMHGTDFTDDADADFLLAMIPHHQSAIDMARIELDQGDDAETLELARRIIEAQEQEIAQMQAMLARLGVADEE
jgi:uncharacterized protein (DUF305 family)